jgi:predicted lipoprotein
VGPPEIDTWKASIDYWPASPDAIGKAIAGSRTHTRESVAALGANAKGFMAIEHLLFDSSTEHTSVLPSLTTASDAEARRAYLVALGEALRVDAAKFYELWRAEGRNLGRELAEGTGFFVSAKVATDQLVRQACFAAIALESTRLGKPLGRQNGGIPVPSLEESPRSDGSLRDLASALEGIAAVYLGRGARDGMGLSDLVRARSTVSDAHVVGHLAATQRAISDIPPPLRMSLVRSTPQVQAAFDASRALKTSLTTEVVSALGTTLTFSDSDGD